LSQIKVYENPNQKNHTGEDTYIDGHPLLDPGDTWQNQAPELFRPVHSNARSYAGFGYEREMINHLKTQDFSNQIKPKP
jgi:hypothetical protein